MVETMRVSGVRVEPRKECSFEAEKRGDFGKENERQESEMGRKPVGAVTGEGKYQGR